MFELTERENKIIRIAVKELFNPKLQELDITDNNSKLIINLKVTYAKTIENIFNLYKLLIKDSSFNNSFSLKCQWGFFDDSNIEFENDLWDVEHAENNEANKHLADSIEVYEQFIPESKKTDFLHLNISLEKLIDTELSPVVNSERMKVYGLMREVVHALVFKYDYIIGNLTEEQKSFIDNNSQINQEKLLNSILYGELASYIVGDGDMATYQGYLLYGLDTATFLGDNLKRLEDLYGIIPERDTWLSDVKIPNALLKAKSLEEAFKIYQEEVNNLINKHYSLTQVL